MASNIKEEDLLKPVLILLVFTLTSCCQCKVVQGSTIWLAPPESKEEYLTWYSPIIQKYTGEVIQYDDKVVAIVDDITKKQVRFRSSRVIWIEADDQTLLERKFRQSFEEKDDDAVLQGLSPVLMERPPVWRQQWLTMVAAVSASRTHRGRISLELVSQLDQRPLPLMVYAWLPIAWTNKSLPQPLITDAVNRLSDSSELVELIASSWILASNQRALAISKLNQLATSDRSEVASLAKVLLWRASTPTDALKSVNQWRDTISKLPMVLQMGPLILLKDKVKSAGDPDMAKHLQWSIDTVPIMKQLEWIDHR